ncbi:MAG: hypothetical protein ACE5IL_14960 [Myxococcota bacterium]
MASSDPRERLRLVDEEPAEARSSRKTRRAGPSDRLAIALGVLLVVGLAWSLWSRAQLQARVRAYDVQVTQLEARLATAESTLAERDRTIRAQERRLGDVRSVVDRLRLLLDAPLDRAALPAR